MDLGITVRKDDNFSDWYTQVITKSELIDYYDISGCYILRPYSYEIWERIQKYVNKALKRRNVKNAYFPLLVSQAALNKEKDHVEGFAPEVAWVTKSGESNLAEPLAIRPTSETIMYPYFAKWVRSYRDLPLKINQWCNVVRWEFKHPTLFLRSREFLWQEGHSVFATKQEADVEVSDILNLYSDVFENLLAIPVIKGRKSEGEKFAGALYTTTCEAFIPAAGKGIQAATAHCLGQNFSKMFDINYLDDHNINRTAWQNSWGLTTRSIGIMIMNHSDDQGLILPPKIAPIQVIIVPIKTSKLQENVYQDMLTVVNNMVQKLSALKIRVQADLRDNFTPAYKYNESELKGVALRIEYGPQNHQKKDFTVALRHTGEKRNYSLDKLEEIIIQLLETVQNELFQRAKQLTESRMTRTTKWEQFVEALNHGNRVLVPWCCQISCEEQVKKKTAELLVSAKSLCIPFEQPQKDDRMKCFACDNVMKDWGLFGKSY